MLVEVLLDFESKWMINLGVRGAIVVGFLINSAWSDVKTFKTVNYRRSDRRCGHRSRGTKEVLIIIQAQTTSSIEKYVF